MDADLPTAKDIARFRDAAVACARAMGSFLQRYSQPLGDGLPLEAPRILIQKATGDIRDLQDLIHEWDRCATPQLLQAIVLANTDIGPEPVFDGYHFSTHHEVARAAAEMAYVTLLILAEDLPDSEPDATRLVALFGRELLEFHRQYSSFAPDRIGRAIDGEAVRAVRYLSSCPNLADLARPNDLQLDSSARESAARTRDPEMEARNRWVYEQSLTDKSWNSIRKELATMPFKGKNIATVGGIRRIALTYARTHGLPELPARKPGRRPE